MTIKQQVGLIGSSSVLVVMGLGIVGYFMIKSKDVNVMNFINEFKLGD